MAELSDETLDMFVDPPEKLGRTYSEYLDGRRLATAQARVLALLLDGKWHTVDELRAVGGSSGDRRARQLRDAKHGGFTVRRERVAGGLWRYKLDNPDPATVASVFARLEVVHGPTP